MSVAPSALPVFAAGSPEAPRAHLSVDGMTAEGPNLSHWPGNRTPRVWKADLSTGICLLFARAPEGEQRAFVGAAQGVVNDHYDTDGFLSMLAVTRPEVALAREELCLLAAATGDYGSFSTRRAFAVDRIVRELPRAAGSPLRRELAGLDGPAREQACYRWLLAHAEQVLDEPESLGALWREELAQVEAELARARCGGLARRRHHGAGLAVLESERAIPRIVLNTWAGAYRVLHVVRGGDGPLYRYHDRTESWFEVVTFAPPPRRDLRPLCRLLGQLEERAGGDGAGEWCCDPPHEPVPELWHGLPGAQAYGEITRTLTPSGLAPALVEERVVAFFAGS